MAAEREQHSGGIDGPAHDAAIRLSIAINKGDPDQLKRILESSYDEGLLHVKDKQGNTALHIAVGRNYVHIITKLLEFQPELCYCTNHDQETPICMAAKLGHLEAVKELIEIRPDAIKISNSCGMNVLHLAAQVSQVRIVDYLNRTKVDLSELVNEGLEKPPSINEGAGKSQIGINYQLETGDTPLHIAARTKNFHMVISLLNIRGINKEAFNEAGLTALDIAKENTEYYENYQIIAQLANYPSKSKPFLYCAPKVSASKYENAIKILNETYEGRRNTELVVAVLLATMSFTAVFTIPGGFKDKLEKGDTLNMLGMPNLIGIMSFKLFIIFDCLAFFVSLFVVLMWQMSTPLTTGDKILFLVITNLMVCASFAFTAYGFMAAVYTMLAHKRQNLAWFLFWACIIICIFGNVTFFYLAARFSVKLARCNYLRGVHPFLRDRVLECIWLKLETVGALDRMRLCKMRYLKWLYGYSPSEAGVTFSKEGSTEPVCISVGMLETASYRAER